MLTETLSKLYFLFKQWHTNFSAQISYIDVKDSIQLNELFLCS